MGKNNKKKRQEKVYYPIEEELQRFLKKYAKLESFIDVEVVRGIFQESIQDYHPEVDISWSLYANFYVESRFFLKVRELIEAGDIDLEIAVISQFSSASRMLLRQLKYTKSDFDQVAELGITNTIENYDGTKSFQLSLLAELKKILNPSLVPPKKEEKVEPENVVQESEKTLPPILEEPVVKEEKKKEIVLPNDGIPRLPTTLDSLIASLDIVKASPIQEEEYVQFLALKYGYYQQQFFNLKEIAEILAIDVEKCRTYYLQSLQFVKDWFGLQLDRYYTYIITNKKTSE